MTAAERVAPTRIGATRDHRPHRKGTVDQVNIIADLAKSETFWGTVLIAAVSIELGIAVGFLIGAVMP